jgi:hypothetical protein
VPRHDSSLSCLLNCTHFDHYGLKSLTSLKFVDARLSDNGVIQLGAPPTLTIDNNKRNWALETAFHTAFPNIYFTYVSLNCLRYDCVGYL